MSRVQIVDDDGPIREFLMIHFEGRGDEVITAQIPIIALTAQKTLDDQIEAHESGCDAFVEKPIDANRLFDAVERILK